MYIAEEIEELHEFCICACTFFFSFTHLREIWGKWGGGHIRKIQEVLE